MKMRAARARQRAGMYALLARLFAAPVDRQLLAQLEASGLTAELASVGVRLPEDEEEVLLDLEVEYTRLFLGPGTHVSPYESVQSASGEGEGMLNGPRTSAVRRAYEAADFALREDFRDLPDHIAAEFEFMAAAAGAEAEALARRDLVRAGLWHEHQRHFLAAHLGTWAGRFCTQVRVVGGPFYAAVADLASAFLAAECDGLQIPGEARRHGAGIGTRQRSMARCG